MSDSAFSAQYGGGGIVYNQISKGGTNQFHGMAYDYFKNTALNAAPFGFNGVSFKTPQHFNDFGGNIGGPVIKNKVFFFFGVENTINHTTPAVSFLTVPTLAMRQGNFAGMNPIYDPTSQTVNPATGVVTRQAFPEQSDSRPACWIRWPRTSSRTTRSPICPARSSTASPPTTTTTSPPATLRSGSTSAVSMPT